MRETASIGIHGTTAIKCLVGFPLTKICEGFKPCKFYTLHQVIKILLNFFRWVSKTTETAASLSSRRLSAVTKFTVSRSIWCYVTLSSTCVSCEICKQMCKQTVSCTCDFDIICSKFKAELVSLFVSALIYVFVDLLFITCAFAT